MSGWVAGHRRVPPEAMEAAVAAARQQAEKVLEDCNARWTERANALETEAQRAQCRIVELEAAAIPEVSFLLMKSPAVAATFDHMAAAFGVAIEVKKFAFAAFRKGMLVDLRLVASSP